jgi:hypothetical protein
MDERLLQVRLAALDATLRVLTGHGEPPTDELVVTYATTIETWLLRPVLVDDGVGPAAEVPAPVPADADPHNAETTADRLGYDRCDTFWRADDGALHRCMHALPHNAPRCVCSCGAMLPEK